MSDIAIKIEHLSKMYRLGVINNGTLWRDIQTYMSLKLGKEDPNSKIGENKYSGDKDHFWALKDVSFEVKQGDRLGIIGKNGAGKSTLLKILSRITTPTEGTIKVKGKIASLLEVGTGFHTELTGRENIFLNGAILGMKKRRINTLLDSIIDFSGIDKHIDTPVKRYSSGMFVRLAFAVAAHLDCDILIADEVLAVGDAEFQKKALGKMQELSTGQGRTVLFVSHNMNAVKQLCNSGIIFEKGRAINASNDIESLTSEYLYSNFKNVKSSVWNNPGKIYEKCFTPLNLQIEDEEGNVIDGTISVNKSYNVKLEFEIKELSSNLNIYLLFATLDGTILFTTNPYDNIENYKMHLGINVLYCSIPPNLLNTNDYNISLGSELANYNIITDPCADNTDPSKVMIKFNVESNSALIFPNRYKSAIAPKLKWKKK